MRGDSRQPRTTPIDWPYTVTVEGVGIVGSAAFRTKRECIRFGRTHEMATKFTIYDRAGGVTHREVRDAWRRVK